jgi:hypothetical protein
MGCCKEFNRIVQATGDKLAEKGKELSMIIPARGLHDFWNERLCCINLGETRIA